MLVIKKVTLVRVFLLLFFSALSIILLKSVFSTVSEAAAAGTLAVHSECQNTEECKTGLTCASFSWGTEKRCVYTDRSSRKSASYCDATNYTCADGFKCVKVADELTRMRCTDGSADWSYCFDSSTNPRCINGLKCVTLQPLRAVDENNHRVCTAGKRHSPCGQDSDCNTTEGLKCYLVTGRDNGHCEYETQSKRTSWALCDNNLACSTGYTCEKIVPEDNLKRCTNNKPNNICDPTVNECMSGYTCKILKNRTYGICVDNNQERRLNNTPCDTAIGGTIGCASGYSCVKNNNEATSIDDYTCSDGFFTAICSQNSDCKTGLRCVSVKQTEANGIDYRRCANGGRNSACSSNSDCITGLECKRFKAHHGQCLPPSNKRQASDRCDDDKVCGSGLTCVKAVIGEDGVGQYFCSDLKNYMPCDADTKTCASGEGTCIDIIPMTSGDTSKELYRCTKGEDNNFCNSDSICTGSNRECSSVGGTYERRCNPKNQVDRVQWRYCDSTHLCATGLKCIKITSTPESVCSGGSDHEICGTNADCMQGFECILGYDTPKQKRCAPKVSGAVNCGQMDGNGDGIISLSEIISLLGNYDKACLPIQYEYAGECGPRDVNGDGKLTLQDLVNILQRYKTSGCTKKV